MRFVWLAFCCLFVAGCEASDSSTPGTAGERNAASASAPSLLDRWNQLMKKGREYAEPSSSPEAFRVVPRGGWPEIILSGPSIRVNGQSVEIGGTLDSWKKALPSQHHCTGGRVRTVCVWRELGLEVATQSARNQSVLDVSVHLALSSDTTSTPAESGSSDDEGVSQGPTRAFPGYLELDGYGIDARTKFSELRARAKPDRNLRCGLRDCSHPHGLFNDNASLYLQLNRADQQGNIVVFTVSGTAEPSPISK